MTTVETLAPDSRDTAEETNKKHNGWEKIR